MVNITIISRKVTRKTIDKYENVLKHKNRNKKIKKYGKN